MADDSSRGERIYLTGFMGSGKSTIGPILANTIGYDFVDVDHVIEKSAGLSIDQIFRERGEAHFRKLERSLIAELSARSHLVISLGGGTIADPESFRTISTSGVVVYLKATPEQIFKRVHHKADRPTLKDITGERLSDEQLRARILDLYRTREPFYSKADIIIRTDERKVGVTVDQIVKKLAAYLG
jgi:shikimate kinase